MTKTIAVYAADTMADWEYAYLTTQVAQAEMIKPGRFRLVFVGDGLEPVTSLGGLPVTPAADLADIAADESLAVLVVPGGETYGDGHERLGETIETVLGRGVPVAAICGATLLLARLGLLDGRRHTSNDPGFLAQSGYAGGELYDPVPVVTDDGVTAATGLRPVAFTAEVMRTVGLLPDDMTAAWERLNDTADPDDSRALMGAIGAWTSE